MPEETRQEKVSKYISPLGDVVPGLDLRRISTILERETLPPVSPDTIPGPTDSQVTSEELERILLEILNGKAPAIPDTPSLAAARLSLQEQVNQAQADGYVIDVPSELPE